MKKKVTVKKLNLEKKVLTRLNNDQQVNILGGQGLPISITCGITCTWTGSLRSVCNC